MRRIVLCLGLFSACVLLAGVATAQKKEVPWSNRGPNGASQCDDAAGNLVANCGFETADFSNWVQSGDPGFTTVSGVPHSGTFADRTGPVDDLGFIAQTLSTTADQAYTLSFWLRNAQTPNRFQVYWDGNLIIDGVDLPDFEYTQYVIPDLVASGDATELKFGFFNVPDYFFLDDVVVVAQ